jgi:hypothetical protein
MLRNFSRSIAPGQHDGFLGTQAQAVHAGVDVQGGVQHAAARVAVPGLDLRQAVEHRRQAGRLDGGAEPGVTPSSR